VTIIKAKQTTQSHTHITIYRTDIRTYRHTHARTHAHTHTYIYTHTSREGREKTCDLMIINSLEFNLTNAQFKIIIIIIIIIIAIIIYLL